jgi:RNA polymerase sigma-70 factor, ECF subfamily
MSIDIKYLETHRSALLKFARLQLRDQSAAEDAVQETLIAAIHGAERFAGSSSTRTWLIGILKHKISDHFRRAAREQPMRLSSDECSLEDFDALFQDDGHFVDEPGAWDSPETALNQREFFAVLERCLEALPPATARAFTMREVLGIETDEICKELSITATNCWVLLYRARMSLRSCLQLHWFGAATARGSKP